MLKLGPRLVWLTGLVLVAGAGLGAVPPLAEAQSSRHEIRATVVDEEGRGVDGLSVAATPYGVAPGEYQGRRTAAGSVRFQLVAGAYSLALYTDQWGQCTVSGLENPEGRLKAAFVAEPGALSRISIVVGARNAPPSARWVPCNFDVPFYRIQGTVLGPDQEPLEGIGVRAVGQLNDPAFGPWTAPATRSNGTFAVEVPNGPYVLELFVEREGSECPPRLLRRWWSAHRNLERASRGDGSETDRNRRQRRDRDHHQVARAPWGTLPEHPGYGHQLAW